MALRICLGGYLGFDTSGLSYGFTFGVKCSGHEFSLVEGTLLNSILFDVRSGRFCVAHPEFLGGQVFPCRGAGGGLTVVVFGCGLFADDLDVADGAY